MDLEQRSSKCFNQNITFFSWQNKWHCCKKNAQLTAAFKTDTQYSSQPTSSCIWETNSSSNRFLRLLMRISASSLCPCWGPVKVRENWISPQRLIICTSYCGIVPEQPHSWSKAESTWCVSSLDTTPKRAGTIYCVIFLCSVSQWITVTCCHI